ncbi:retrovirus-related pol polyprotein from transposon TNT 1-94 [Tanacetum coccineum]
MEMMMMQRKMEPTKSLGKEKTDGKKRMATNIDRITLKDCNEEIWNGIGTAEDELRREISSRKALDEGYSSKNYVRKFLRALHPKWRAKVTAIEESKDLTLTPVTLLNSSGFILSSRTAAIQIFLLEMSKTESQGHRAFVGGSWSDSGEEYDEKVKDETCLVAQASNEHRRLGHVNMRLIQSLASKELVRNLPKLKFDQHFCDACKIRKQAHASHKAKNIVSTTRCLELLHMDLFGPSTVRSFRGNCYTLVIVDDYSRYTWTRFLKDKTKAFDQFEIFSRKIQNQLGCTIVSIRTDHGREYDNEVQFGEFCNANGITHNFSTPRTPQSNGVVERKIGNFKK